MKIERIVAGLWHGEAEFNLTKFVAFGCGQVELDPEIEDCPDSSSKTHGIFLESIARIHFAQIGGGVPATRNTEVTRS